MFSLSKKVSSQVRAGVKRGFPLAVCLLQEKITQLLSSPFRTILVTDLLVTGDFQQNTQGTEL